MTSAATPGSAELLAQLAFALRGVRNKRDDHDSEAGFCTDETCRAMAEESIAFFSRLAAKPAEEGWEALHRSFADAVVTMEGVANAIRHNPELPPEQIRHDLLLNVRLYREAAEANGIDIRTIKPDGEPYDFRVERDGHAALDRALSTTGEPKR